MMTESALMAAARAGDSCRVVTLLSDGADANETKPKSLITPLALAARMGHVCALKALLTGGADINATSWTGWTALMSASFNGHYSAVRLLLAHDDVDAAVRDTKRRDCLEVADSDAIKALHVTYRANKERERLVDIGLSFASKRLPVHLLVALYEQSIVFEDQRVSLFNCWEILKHLKIKQ